MANTPTLSQQEKKIVGLAALGGMLEFYDFIIYGIFSVYFANQFFPHNNHLLSVIESYIVFVLGYIARPIGGIIFSHIGDEYGRKKVLIITIILMGLASLGIGILPTYAQIGISAPICLLALRLIQGLALGGELPSTYVYVTESMPDKRGIGFGITMTGVNSGLLLGMLVNQCLNLLLSNTQLTTYGWRIPFIIGGLLCIISYKIRKTLHETTVFNRIYDKPDFPLWHLFKNYPKELLIGIAITAIMSGLVVAAIIFMPTYLHEIVKVDNQLISRIMPVVMLFNTITIYYTGKLAGLTDPPQILLYLILSSFILAPLGYLLISYNFILVGVIILSILEGMAAMLIPLLITSLFPAKIRLTGVAMSYNIGFTIFGGLSPIIITSAIKSGLNVYLTPCIYIILTLIIALSGALYTNKAIKSIK